MRVIICENYEEMSNEAAKIVAGQIMLKPNCTLGLATGSTPVGMYKKLCEMNKNGEIDFSEVKSFNLDEYYPISSENEQSYHYFMNKNLFNNVNIKEENTHILDGAAKHCAVKAMLKETADTDVPATVLNLHDDVVLSRKKVIRTPILRGGFSLSTSLKYSAIRQDYLRFFLAQSKIRSLKILRPEKNRILSRFWCGR